MRSLIVLVPLCLFISGSLGVGNTTCLSDRLDWYTDAVGETPCTTYQRLRQLCNSDYEVGAFSPKTPGDNCDDQVSACCCNSVSWALSMLCMNCQQDASASVNGIDAGKGAYQMYLHSGGNGELCSPMTNGSLPADIQQAVCNAGIKLDNFLYNLFWDDGSWFYSYTRESAETDQAANNNNTFTHCPNQAQSSGAPSATPNAPSSAGTPNTSTPSSSAPAGSPDPPASASSHGSRPPTAAIVVGTIGGLIALAALAVLVLLLRRRSAHVHVRARPVSLASCMAAASGSAGHTDPFALSAHTDPSVLSARTDPFVLAAPSAPRTPEKGARAPPASVSVLDSDYGYGYGCGYRVAYDARASEAALSDAGSRGTGGCAMRTGALSSSWSARRRGGSRRCTSRFASLALVRSGPAVTCLYSWAEACGHGAHGIGSTYGGVCPR
ncbi:hypothetical protein B0H21DRAFT_250993 [Amylocystis lapponica]|nr:hypothetical protein B0H21DRAFT_250993 [Amylocystis lapponica]